MKLSDKPTAYVLLKAGTNSEWDNCNFAIIHITEDWKKEQQKRLEMVRPFAEDYFLQSLNYYDTAVDFYTADEDDNPDLYKWLESKPMAYVDIDKEELQTLSVPENRLDCYRLVLYSHSLKQIQRFDIQYFIIKFRLKMLYKIAENRIFRV